MATCSNCGRDSPDEFEFCPACGRPLATPASGREVRKILSVIFCDVSGSTALGERLDPESLRDVQARYFEAMRLAIERHGGTVEKYIGDAVMAVFGIPQLHEDDALRAARAAADMREGRSGESTPCRTGCDREPKESITSPRPATVSVPALPSPPDPRSKLH
jgi:class 3 adenylate cyclase